MFGKIFGKMFGLKRLWIVLTGVFAAFLIAMVIGSLIAFNNTAAINMIFGITPTRVIGTTEAMRFESDWADVNGEGLFIEDKIMTRKAAAEGMTLLWNRDLESGEKALPLAAESKLSCFSHSTVDIVESGTGSGYIRTVTQTGEYAGTSLKTAFERYFKVNERLWNFYDFGEGSGSAYTRSTNTYGEKGPQKIGEVPWSVYTDPVKDSFAEYADAAIVFISRTGGENGDLHNTIEENTREAGAYLALTQEEKDLLRNVCANAAFRRVVIVMNTGNPIQMKDLDPYVDDIDAAVWMGQCGTAGVNALAELLSGNESPSGRMSDTLAYDLYDHPSTANDRQHTYTNISGRIDTRYQGHYMVYAEGIYVGYRYFETRYMDGVTDAAGRTTTNAASAPGAGGAAAWSYDDTVAFPFGYGCSYSDFSYDGFHAVRENDAFNVTLRVKNNGPVASKEVVQIYLSKPYTKHDKAVGIEVPGIELVGFAKTSKLKVGSSETVTVTVPLEYFKTYDAAYDNGDGTFGRYVIEAGDYTLTAATDAHIAANNILSEKGLSPSAQRVMVGGRDVKMGAGFVESFTLAADSDTFKGSTQTGKPVYNRLDEMDINKYSGRGENGVTYLSRSNWRDTYPAEVALDLTTEMVEDLKRTHVTAKNDPDNMPEYGVFASGSASGKPDVDNGDLVAFDFIDAPLNAYDERWNEEWAAKWDRLLDQMTWYEQANISANAFHQLVGAESVAFPSSRQENGPVGITKRGETNFQIPNQDIKDWTFVCYPSAPVLASTFNVEIVEQVGRHMSEDMLYLGYNGIYGPGANLHRSPFGGRNWEYYSEDPVLTGRIGYAQTKGIESKGCLAYVKHFAFNDMETFRHYCGIWSNEQAAREIYLKAYEMIFAEGGASATMNSFTRVGTRWSGMSKELQTDILRTEWGWDGINITDWVHNGFMSQPDAIFAGTNSFDGNGKPETYFGGWENDPELAQCLRESAKIIIYNVVGTHTFNGMTRKSIVEVITPWWQTALVVIIVVLAVLTVAVAAMLTLSVLRGRRERSIAGGKTSEDHSEEVSK